MPLEERGGAADDESRVELLLSVWLVKGLVVPEERLEPRERGRKPARRDMSGLSVETRTQSNEAGVCTGEDHWRPKLDRLGRLALALVAALVLVLPGPLSAANEAQLQQVGLDFGGVLLAVVVTGVVVRLVVTGRETAS
jgi:hypothetical protein